jgi:hypothetical protein
MAAPRLPSHGIARKIVDIVKCEAAWSRTTKRAKARVPELILDFAN